MAHSVHHKRSASVPAELPSYLAKFNSENPVRSSDFRNLQAQYWQNVQPILPLNLVGRAAPIDSAAPAAAAQELEPAEADELGEGDPDENDLGLEINATFAVFNRQFSEGRDTARDQVIAYIRSNPSGLRPNPTA